MDSEDKIHDYLEEVTSKCDHDSLLKNEQELKPMYLPISLLKAITQNFSDGLQIGSGGFAVVYKGLLKRGGTVAVKKLLNTVSMDDNQFLKEVSCLMRVRHKNIVRFLGYCSDTQGKLKDYKGKLVLAEERERLLCFEYLPNGTLEKHINDASGGLEWNKRHKIIKGICEGLQYLHENNIVHLDLKPANILLNDNMVPKISDFGLSRSFEGMQSRIVTSTLSGSIGYLAPEFFSGEITRKLDIYSLGVIIAEMLTGKKGYSRVENVLECWRKRFEDSYLDTDKLLEQVRVCAKIRVSCGNPDPTERPDIQQITTILNELPDSDEFPKAREMDKMREGKPDDSRAALRSSVRENGSDIAEKSGDVVSRSVTGSVISRDFGYADAHMDRHMAPKQIPAATGPADWREALEIVALGLPDQSVEGMKLICRELTQAEDPESTVLEDLIKEADRLVSCLAVMVPKTFNFSLSGGSSMSCKYALNTLMQTFQIKRLALAVKEGTLENLIKELLLWLLDERIPLMDDGSQLLKALNVLMIKILDNAERTSSFVVLINLLRPLDPSRWPSPTPTESLVVKNQKFSDLVVKCLIKLTKVLQSTIYEVDLDRLLQSIHIYYQELGMEEIRRRAGADDKPLRMVKTVTHELVKLRGTAIKGHLSMVPIDAEPQPIILAYIDLNLQTLAAAGMLPPSGPITKPHEDITNG